VSSLVSAVEQLNRIGDKERKSEAEDILNKSLELTCEIKKQLAAIGTVETPSARESNGNIHAAAAPGVVLTKASGTAIETR
jgi:hypothetical protein